MAARPFRILLRNQIVVPPLVVSMSVALLAIFAGVSGLSGIVDSWSAPRSARPGRARACSLIDYAATAAPRSHR